MAIVSQGKKMRGWKCETNRKPRYHAQGRVSSSLNGGRKRKKKEKKILAVCPLRPDYGVYVPLG